MEEDAAILSPSQTAMFLEEENSSWVKARRKIRERESSHNLNFFPKRPTMELSKNNSDGIPKGDANRRQSLFSKVGGHNSNQLSSEINLDDTLKGVGVEGPLLGGGPPSNLFTMGNAPIAI